MNDPETAADIAQRPDPTEAWTPKVADFDLHAIMLREVISALSALHQAVLASAGAKPKPIKPFPTPVTEVDREKKRQEREFAVDLIKDFGFAESDL